MKLHLQDLPNVIVRPSSVGVMILNYRTPAQPHRNKILHVVDLICGMIGRLMCSSVPYKSSIISNMNIQVSNIHVSMKSQVAMYILEKSTSHKEVKESYRI